MTISITGVIYLSSLGIGAAATILISNYAGANNITGIREANRSIMVLMFCFTVACSVAVVLGRFFLAELFISETDVINLAAMLILIMGLFQLPDGLNVTISGILRGLLDIKVPTIINSLTF